MEIITPGKVILGGEHAVVYGTPAIASPTGENLIVRGVWEERNDKIWHVHEERGQWEVERQATPAGTDVHPFIERSIREGEALGTKLLRKRGKDVQWDQIPGGRITLVSRLPGKSGLGSSAAVAATIAEIVSRVMVEAHGESYVPRPLKDLEQATHNVEKLIHKTPSGIDSTTSTHNGLVWFRNEKPGPKIIQMITGVHPVFQNKFHILHSGVPEETTGEMVEYVRRYLKKGSRAHKRLRENEQAVRELYAALMDGNVEAAGEAINTLSKWLVSIGVVGKRGQEVLRACEQAGMPAKVCGAGGRAKGSGVFLVLSRGNTEAVEALAEKLEAEVFSFALPIDSMLDMKDVKPLP